MSLVVCVLTADRLGRLLERFGLSMSSLSQSGSLSLNTLVNIALTLGVQHTSDSEYVSLFLSTVLVSCLYLSVKFAIGNDCVSKNVVNCTISYFFTAISILVISNHNSFRVLFYKIAFEIYFI